MLDDTASSRSCSMFDPFVECQCGLSFRILFEPLNDSISYPFASYSSHSLSVDASFCQYLSTGTTMSSDEILFASYSPLLSPLRLSRKTLQMQKITDAGTCCAACDSYKHRRTFELVVTPLAASCITDFAHKPLNTAHNVCHFVSESTPLATIPKGAAPCPSSFIPPALLHASSLWPSSLHLNLRSHAAAPVFASALQRWPCGRTAREFRCCRCHLRS